MTTDEYITYLRSINIIVTSQEDKIAIEDPNDVLTSEIVEELKTRKPDILDFFNLIKSKKELFIGIPKSSVSVYYPLSSAQKRMYFLYEFDKQSTAYNIPVFFRIGRPLDVSRLELAFTKLVSRHQSLRTVFEIVEGIPVQRILNDTSFKMGHYSGNTSDMSTYISTFVRPFNLASEFPIRISLMDVIGEDYLLMFDMHHIINDGLSQEILMHEFWLLYKGEELEDLRIQYTDYAVWQQSDAHQSLVSTHKSYWLELFDKEITALELPLDYSRPLYKGGQGDSHFLNLDKQNSTKLRWLASSNGVTVYTLFLAVYNILLSKLCNQDDIIVGTPTAGRHHADLEAIVGMFVNTLALRNHVDAGLTFKDFLATVHESTLLAFDHQLYQYEELVDALELPRDASRNSLFDIFFSYQNQVNDSGFNDPDLKISLHDVSYNIAKFDLSLAVLDSEEISLSFTYRTDLFTASSAVRFCDYLGRIIDEILEDETQLIGDMTILSEKEKSELLVDFNDTFADYDLQQTVLDMFMAQSAKTPAAVAIILGEEVLTYSDLNLRSDLWASHLVDSGVVPGSIVGLITTRSSEMITAIVAVMKCGAAYVPVNPTQPISRTDHMLEECGCQFVITNLDQERVAQEGYTFLSAELLDAQQNPERMKENVLPGVTSDSLAYVIYTSGSTGNPKGVMVHHESVTNLINYEREFLGIEASDRILQFSPYYFDPSIEQIWLSLTTGATLILIEEEMLLDRNIFNSYLIEKGVTHLHSTPSFLERVDFEGLSALRRVISGGEICKFLLAETISNKYPFYNKYGPTETTVTFTIHKIIKEYNLENKVSIGRPIANTQAYILDAQMKLLPVGVRGELYIGGKGLSKGYLNRLDLTGEHFIKNPFGSGLLYKTGDLAKWLSDGNIDYLGRNDNQIKLRGYRIELGEIESQLESMDSVSQALVIAHGSDDNKQLIAYLCSSQELEMNQIRLLLSAKLPDYMIPAGYIWLDSFPVTANGKIDKRMLPNPDFTKGEVYTGAENQEQEKLVEIWSEVLGIEASKISINSDFFNLGGHSLKAITLVNKISKLFSVNLSLRDLFVHRTISKLSAHIISIDKISFVSISTVSERDYYPLSSAQKRMYFLYEFDKESTAYNMPGFFRIGRPLDVLRLELAFTKLVSRHQSLRTVFEIVEGLPVQRILDDNSFKMEYYSGNISDMNTYINTFIRPFNLSAEFPIRISLMEVTDEDYLLMFDMHHIINDGVSHEILMREFWLLYKGEELDTLRIQYTDYAVWQQSDAHQSLVSTHKAYWLELYSKEITALELPLDYSRPLYKGGQGNSHSLHLDSQQSAKLRSLASSNGVTVYTLFLAVYNILLSKLCNQDDIIVGTPTAGRHHADLEGIVGMFVNTLALRNYVDPGMVFKDFLATVHESTLSAFDHQLYQYEELVDALELPRDASRNSLFDVFFSYQNQVNDSGFNDPDLKISLHDVSYNIAKFDLSLAVLDSEEISLSFTYRTDLFTASSAVRFCDYLGRIIDEILEDETQLIGDMTILSEEEKSELLVDFNDTFADYDLQQTVLDMFVAQSAKTPAAAAIVLGEEVLTYNDLDLRSDLWASHLVDSGVVPGSIVGLITTRSSEMITAIVAVMKCGAAYVPVNPTQPVSRTDHMLEECGCQFVITNLDQERVALEGYTFLSAELLDAQQNPERMKKNVLPGVTSDSLAYVIYTSGSTGNPKGVMVHHESVTNLINYEREFLGVEASDRILQFSPYYFDVSVEQIWLSLTTGAGLVLIDSVVLTDQDLFVEYLDSHSVTLLNVTPSFLESLSLPPLQSLKRIVVSGEECKPGLARRYNRDYDFYNEYGPTETTVISISQKLTSEVLKRDKVSIGRPIANTQAYILDAQMNLLPVGVKGDLYIGGKGLSKGYLNRLDLTGERFIKNPFGSGLLYKTGDLAKWLSDGTIDYLGRSDNQIKLRGYRIELGEIESQLESMDSVSQALVIAHGSDDNKQLIAYLCSSQELEMNQIRLLLSAKLPDYMIPAGYIWLDSFPVTANGKIDKRMLPNPDFTKGEVYTGAENQEQEKLVEIWSEVLGIEASKISINSDFFNLGGHSLKAITLVNKISKLFSVNLSLRDLFVHRTISKLSAHIISIDKISFVSISTVSERDYYPLSSAQKRMYFLYEFDKESTAYNMPGFFRIGRPLDVLRLELAFTKLVSRHQSLRTVFEIVEGLPVQRILDDNSFKMEYYSGNISDMNTYINTFIRPFNLSAEFPIRISLMEVTDEDYLLMFDMHHIINDGVSHEILMREFWLLYKGEELDTLRIQYTDYAVWQQSDAHQSLVSTHKAYWLELYSKEITALELPLDYSRPLYKGGQGNSHSLHLDSQQSTKLRFLASSNGVTVYTLFLAVYNILLSKLCNQDDIIVGTPTAGRHHADLEGIVGMFVNTLALRNYVDPGMVFKDFLATVHESTLSAFDHQLYQYEELVDALELPRDASRNSLFDVSFTYQMQVDDSAFNDPALKISFHEVSYNIAKFDLSLAVLDSEEISLSFTYRTDLFTASSAVRFCDYLGRIIDEILEDETQLIGDMTILSEEEKSELLVDFNDTFADYDLQQTVLDMFVAQSAKTPAAAAIVLGEEVLTYSDLDLRSDLWASHLVDSGVVPGSIVGLITTRSSEMITAIVAVMKCGAAYVPVNPTQPVSRTDHMLEECGCQFVITNLDQERVALEGYTFLSAELLDAQQNPERMKKNVLPGVTSDSLAYVIYTSGSTGNPKGVMVHHESVTNLINYEREFLGVEASDRILQFSPYYFDVSVEQIWLSLTTGAGLVLIDSVVLTDQDLFVEYLDSHSVTLLNVTPSFLESLSLPPLQSLKRIVVSGEECKPGLARRYNRDYDFYNEYGPTETTVISISQKLTSEVLKRDKVSIGRPIANTQAYILDAQMNLLPVGVKGDLYIGGKGLSKGYLNRLDLTGERFIKNPFGSGLLYKTGDLAKWLSDGTIDYLGRSDNQIKLNGVRIELGEIESHLKTFKGIKDAAVSLSEIESNKNLVAYYVAEEKILKTELKEHLIERLPFSMVPIQYMQLDKLPLSPTGKLDRRLLPDIEKKERVYVAPSNEIEKQLVLIWSELLHIEMEKINVDDGFFELGGNSLKAIALMNTISKIISVKITLKEIFVKQTIREIADYIITIKQITDTIAENKEEIKLIL